MDKVIVNGPVIYLIVESLCFMKVQVHVLQYKTMFYLLARKFQLSKKFMLT